MRRHQRAWTLIEILVVMALGGVVLLVVTRLFESTNKVTQVQTQRALLQGQLQSVLWELEQSLQGACSAGIAWRPASAGQPALLVVHPYQTGAINLQPQWSPYWRCFIWDQAGQALYFKQIPPGPPALSAPSVGQPQIPTSADMAQIGLNPSQAGKLLSNSVSNITYAREVGPLVRISVELEKSIPNRVKTEKFYAERLFQLRNRP